MEQIIKVISIASSISIFVLFIYAGLRAKSWVESQKDDDDFPPMAGV